MQIMLSLCQLVFSSIISIRKLIGGLYQDEVTLNLTFTRRLGYTKPTTVKWSVIFHLTTEYQNYVSLNTADRKITYPDHSHACESGLGPGWFRFEGSAGTRMPTPCPPYDRCDTDATTWINGSHITVADGQVSRQVCFHWTSSCCEWSTNIKVRNCGSYFVYYLSGTSVCSLRYCGTD